MEATAIAGAAPLIDLDNLALAVRLTAIARDISHATLVTGVVKMPTVVATAHGVIPIAQQTVVDIAVLVKIGVVPQQVGVIGVVRRVDKVVTSAAVLTVRRQLVARATVTAVQIEVLTAALIEVAMDVVMIRVHSNARMRCVTINSEVGTAAPRIETPHSHVMTTAVGLNVHDRIAIRLNAKRLFRCPKALTRRTSMRTFAAN
ncbi:MAG: hypothetical protein H0T78_02095 [Longispora sp.]|nr:hypothetical protein [Longispora sp. (in: high G+C Gram-positive bacteria)]